MFNTERRKAEKVARAIQNGYYDRAKLLLQAGAGGNGVLSKRGTGHLTSLMLAVSVGQLELVISLLGRGADVHARDVREKTALHYLPRTGDVGHISAIATVLLQAGADIEARNNQGQTPLHDILEYRERAAAVSVLLRHGASIDFQPSYFGPALVLASRRDEPAVIEELIRYGADIAAVGWKGYTALHMAAREGNGNVVRLLMEMGADTQARDKEMNTPADVAQEHEHVGIASYIRQHAGSARKTDGGWVKVSDEEIAFVSDKKAVGYRLTEIFNFMRREATIIARNLETGSESIAVRDFNSYAQQDMVLQAAEKLSGATGHQVLLPSKAVIRKTGGG